MFVAIAKLLYLDLKEQKLKIAEPANEMAELEQKHQPIHLQPTNKKPPQKACKC